MMMMMIVNPWFLDELTSSWADDKKFQAVILILTSGWADNKKIQALMMMMILTSGWAVSIGAAYLTLSHNLLFIFMNHLVFVFDYVFVSVFSRRYVYLVKDMSKTFAHVNVVERDRKGLEHLADTENKRKKWIKIYVSKAD